MALELIDAAIAELEGKLNLAPGESIIFDKKGKNVNDKKKNDKKKNKGKTENNNNVSKKGPVANLDQPDICKLEFKVGQIKKCWIHPDADKLYCEEIDCGEEEPRQIASGLRPHYTLEEMQGRRLIVVSNLKVRNFEYFYIQEKDLRFVLKLLLCCQKISHNYVFNVSHL